MKTIEARDWTPETLAYLWVETGNGNLYRVTGIRQDWWIVTGRSSWCCCSDTVLYVFDCEAECKAKERYLQKELKDKRKRWYSNPKGEN